ncbi:MAG TPA: 1-deoxy-D-xylulose-5-phosphate synthase [Candidatus Lambdaproteobacteria bacterium]|jgi:1-deoxy-D-xylulose-5-phosphate synthase|uniref:1-deoxy-D-xylulose-5-phosphate synthase n=1 Tax=SAR324 cluster bacterium TaxID=2024889 RepID=A0A432GBW7_9DELT|nr:MAG: 1-deoxy-D-xylulose-5-phosphate synthase [SAR324 cluster bacterium]HHZ85840.1 1-deoxy-D-xylulose-5-phosphate synthase [Candidatus Lambdaproteobacteria bacterium]HIB15625.1 1-deoxy-D-xylulose-5-phosphate synthase [Candidatus Lambdaproteobacteria bacterium]
MKSLLESISQPTEIQNLNLQELTQLAEECRQRIIEVTSQRGGHLASSLGTVEITVALLKNFNFNIDRIVWDVGHQAYAYKILTGRNEKFDSLGKAGGIKKFLSRDESSFDHFGAGHASTSISAALGMAIGRDLQQKKHRVIAVIGDGAMTGGLAFEALNHNGALDKNMLVIYNDNSVSIDPNVGAISKLLTRFASSRFYNSFREETLEFAEKAPFSERLGLKTTLQKLHDSAKSFFSPPSMLFEQLGWRYFGTVDGHDLPELLDLINHVKDLDGPIVIHAITQKGKGYAFAEEDAHKYHGVTPFEPEDGKFVKKKSSGNAISFSQVFGNKLGELMARDEQVVVVTAAMLSGTGIVKLQPKYPERVLDVGIAEGHAVTCSAGLATTGSKPFVAIYSTFLQRALDHIIHDVAIQKLPVRFMLDRAGFVGADGPTHHGLYDLTYLRMIPNMTIMVPRDGEELRGMMELAYNNESGPSAIRYPRGNTANPDENDCSQLEFGKAQILRKGKDIALFAIGLMVDIAEQTADLLEKNGYSVAVVNARFVKPLDEDVIVRLGREVQLLVSLEENTIHGGFGSGVLETLSVSGICVPTLQLGVPDRFIAQGNPDEQLRSAELSMEQIYSRILERLPVPAHKKIRKKRTVSPKILAS